MHRHGVVVLIGGGRLLAALASLGCEKSSDEARQLGRRGTGTDRRRERHPFLAWYVQVELLAAVIAKLCSRIVSAPVTRPPPAARHPMGMKTNNKPNPPEAIAMRPTNWAQAGHTCLTANQEWLIDRATCVAVRDRSSDAWLEDHFALHEHVELVPRSATTGGKRQWDLQVSTFGLTLQMGPVLAIHPAHPTLFEAHHTRRAG